MGGQGQGQDLLVRVRTAGGGPDLVADAGDGRQRDGAAAFPVGGERAAGVDVTAAGTRTLPSVNAWGAARYTLPGIVAHESARQGGARLEIPDFGDAPGA